jgi:hypothetical protein
MIRFETVNGSLYALDEAAGTWSRLRPGRLADPQDPLRNEGDVMIGHSAVILGYPVRIYGPSLRPDRDRREIETTAVAKLLEPADGAAAWGKIAQPIIISLRSIHD